ncbi:peptidoglycan DD-metalloendopeptidase family protein [Streptoalloteichus tenebrarius]|uniref:peptidoglycan DD-metalloendopeptidase family protein n=1 Tax=Streptoalloteichus tenebrarius (strain ATCC 17920 / DSM 40477 / JCM 4838 / CBS 697.72 / NBRC 16177 / NCIMB 11028 / NRRL B-12390 / A12253. 1 / ISP 5477) TaxID=1933 RepID=UPI0035EF7FE7
MSSPRFDRPAGRRGRTAAAGVAAAVLLGATTVLLAGAAPAAAEPATATGGVEPALASVVSGKLLAEQGAQIATTYGAPGFQAASGDVLVEGKRTSRDRSWVFGGSVVRVPSTTHASPVTALFVGHRVDGRWQVELEGNPGFAALVRSAPAEVVRADERETLARTAAPAAEAAGLGLALPWTRGQAWGSAGVHGDSGTSRPFNAIDFSGGDGRVLAARAGKLYRFCTNARWPLMKLVHDNGWTTGYYHTRNQTSKGEGAQVAAGEYLGQTGNELPCGGSSTGAHVHFTLWQGNRPVSVNGKTIGGWTFYEGSRPYSGYAERNGRRINLPGGGIVNYGADNDTTPSATVRNNGGTVNLRSGPGTSYDVVGTVRDGDVVQIVCTARGDELTGPWGNRNNVWDRLTNGRWISDAFVDTGTNEPVAPACS